MKHTVCLVGPRKEEAPSQIRTNRLSSTLLVSKHFIPYVWYFMGYEREWAKAIAWWRESRGRQVVFECQSISTVFSAHNVKLLI